MNRSDLTASIAWLDALAAAAKVRAARLREQLTADARAEFEEQDTAPTWRIRDLGQVIASVSREAAVVVDEVRFAEWVARRYPTETVPAVRPAWQTRFLAAATRTDGGQVVDPDTGEVVPGLGVRPGGEFAGVSIRLDRDARTLLADAAEVGLRQVASVAGTVGVRALEAADA